MSNLEFIEDHRVVRILLPLKGSSPVPRDCVAIATSHPFFEAVFLSGQLPVDNLDKEGKYQVTFFAEGRNHLINAVLDGIVDESRLRLKTTEIVTPGQKRENFRVDADLSLIYRRAQKEGEEQSISSRMNISGGGVWFPVREKLVLKESLDLELVLDPEAEIVVPAVGEVVRLTEVRKELKGVGIKFVEISSKDRDRIIAFCFAEQRKQLRDRVRVIDFD